MTVKTVIYSSLGNLQLKLTMQREPATLKFEENAVAIMIIRVILTNI